MPGRRNAMDIGRFMAAALAVLLPLFILCGTGLSLKLLILDALRSVESFYIKGYMP